MIASSTSNQQFHEVCGAIHLHTKYSDGGVDYPELIAIAKEIDLDYIVVTDHMTLKGRQEGYEGFSDNLCVVVGYEHNDMNNINHYLALGVTKVAQSGVPAQHYIDEIKKDGGIGFIAHPIERRYYFKDYPAYPWNSWDATGFDGIELWNQMSDWLENLRSWLNFFRLFYPRRFLKKIDNEIIRRWDEYNRVSFMSGIGGIDAHTKKTKIGIFRLTVFPIKVELKGIRTHLFLNEPLSRENPERSREILLSALKNGRGFISNFRRNDARGTRFFIEFSDGKLLPPGFNGRKNAAPALPACIHVQLVEMARINLFRNGILYRQTTGSNAQFEIDSQGLYRIEVSKGENVWIYSNPFPVGAYPLWQ
jgi:hypothetical protein